MRNNNLNPKNGICGIFIYFLMSLKIQQRDNHEAIRCEADGGGDRMGYQMETQRDSQAMTLPSMALAITLCIYFYIMHHLPPKG